MTDERHVSEPRTYGYIDAEQYPEEPEISLSRLQIVLWLGGGLIACGLLILSVGYAAVMSVIG